MLGSSYCIVDSNVLRVEPYLCFKPSFIDASEHDIFSWTEVEHTATIV